MRSEAAIAALADELGLHEQEETHGETAQTWKRYQAWRDGGFMVEWDTVNGQQVVLLGEERGRGKGRLGPLFSATQLKAINDRTAKYMLLHGERGSGKSIGALYKLAIHCYEEKSALGLIIVQVTSMAEEGGAWHKLVYDVFPVLRDYFGLAHTEARLAPTSKKPYIWVYNRHGSSSRCTLMSLPVDASVKDRIKGTEPSMVVVDEAQVLVSDSYFSDVVQQVGRRPRISSQQQVVYCANPAGPSHWLYTRFFIMPTDEGEWNPDYAVYHVPISENIDRLPVGYYDTVIEAVRGDEVEMARMVRGEWVDRADGTAIFRDVWVVERHFIGDPLKNIGIEPLPGFTIIAGYDLGPVHASIHFEQLLPIDGGLKWIVFDEINTVGQAVPYQVLVPTLMARMDYWEEFLTDRSVSRQPVGWDHISDDSAFNQRRTDGSFDVRKIQDLSRNRIILRAAPKGKGSRAERVRSVTELLSADALMVSAICLKTKAMFEHLTSERQTPGEYDPEAGLKPRKSIYLHSFDSLTYPIITIRLGGARPRVGKVSGSSTVVRIGGG